MSRAHTSIPITWLSSSICGPSALSAAPADHCLYLRSLSYHITAQFLSPLRPSSFLLLFVRVPRHPMTLFRADSACTDCYSSFLRRGALPLSRPGIRAQGSSARTS
ncbi:hypothetical protein B0H17DRAFT_1328868 [Mycena rosella]|uniref:Uncharacterized protein n=1 Tax=Mycena rosella TaxID=1033263 RepID=A0AAD7GMD6_MYCRO|nr:hypothetical protein B0H17DRAFT_1328868 [Mycena rosella]